MPMKPDDAGMRSVELAFEVPGTPDEVWRAIATGPGIGAWFVPSEVEERVGGHVKFDLGGGMVSSGHVTAWEPPRRFAYQEPDWSAGAPPLGTEFVIEALSGERCRIRLVHSLATDSDRWDDEVGGMETGWPPFFEVLRIYLMGFKGQPAVSLRPMGGFPGSLDEAWDSLSTALGLEEAKVGDHVVAPPDAPRLEGGVLRVSRSVHQREALLQLTEPAPGAALAGVFSFGGQVMVALSIYFYGERAEAVAARERPRWDDWIARRYPKSA